MCPQLLMLVLVHPFCKFSRQLNIYFGGPTSLQVVTNRLYKQTTWKGNYGTASFLCKSAGLLPLFYMITIHKNMFLRCNTCFIPILYVSDLNWKGRGW